MVEVDVSVGVSLSVVGIMIPAYATCLVPAEINISTLTRASRTAVIAINLLWGISSVFLATRMAMEKRYTSNTKRLKE